MKNFITKIYLKFLRIKNTQEDLEMIFPDTIKDVPLPILNDHYTVKIFIDEYRMQFLELIEAADMSGCDLDYWISISLPDGFFLIIENISGQVVGACLAAHKPNERNKYGGCLGWLAVHPAHRGNQLGYLLSAYVVNRLKDSGYHNIYLGTQDFRLSAIVTYLKLGWKPNLYSEEMYDRWKRVYYNLKIDFPHELDSLNSRRKFNS